MRITNDLSFNPHPITGDTQPEVFWGSDEPAATSTFSGKNVGTYYWQRVTANHLKHWFKVKDDNRADDWVLVQGVICQRVAFGDFTDGGAAIGSKDLNATIPAGSYVEKTLVTNITGFTGDTSATLQVGVTAGDVDRFTTGTPSVFTTAAQGVDVGVPSGTRWMTAAAIPTLLITSATDWGAVAAGNLTVMIFYYGAAL